MRVLITGMSGVGKSTVVDELVRRGHPAHDLDVPRWSEYAYPDTKHGGPPDGRGPHLDWLWREDRVGRLLATETDDVLFVAGCAANQGEFRSRLDHVVLLSAPVPVMIQRIATRTTNPFGKAPGELAKILADTEAVEPLLRASATCEIDATAPLESVVDRILDLVPRRHRRSAGP